ncbi:MAG: hypothetical protein EOS18_24690 [Mesorhizobium sp.]|nr:MAG: hypothetical protein EOS18_24690 [Mesorhizobium sp.]
MGNAGRRNGFAAVPPETPRLLSSGTMIGRAAGAAAPDSIGDGRSTQATDEQSGFPSLPA